MILLYIKYLLNNIDFIFFNNLLIFMDQVTELFPKNNYFFNKIYFEKINKVKYFLKDMKLVGFFL